MTTLFWRNFASEYEAIIFNMAIADKIPRNLLKRYFKECGHQPSENLINVAYADIFKGIGYGLNQFLCRPNNHS